MAHHGDDTGFGFRIPSSWPKWKKRCSAHRRSSPEIQCGAWAVRGMPTCRKHGSGGARNAKIGLIRYLAWIIIGCPQDTPWPYAKFASMAATLEMLFNKGLGNPEQRLRAAMWIAELGDVPEKGVVPAQRLIIDDVNES